jgi:hypothetical protein
MTFLRSLGRARPLLVVCGVLVLVALVAGTAAAQRDRGFKTDQPSMIAPVAAGVTVDPIITVGETLSNGYMFESIPDGISFQRHGRTIRTLVNHELSLVPFPLGPPPISDFTNALLSELTLDRRTAGVLDGAYVIPNEAGYQRFCSNFLASGRNSGFEFPLLFTNEEASDFVNRSADAWPPGPEAEQAGVVVAYNPRTREYRSIYGMGRHNHENSVAIPGYRYPVIVSGDDTFNAPSSQFYMYIAQNARAVWNDEGALYAFRSSNPNINDYGDLSGTATVSGEFIPVPREIAVADQAALEDWSNENNVFQFIRIEDTAFDRRHPNVHYLADTGEPRALPDPATGRLMRGPSGTMGPWPNGRIFKMVLDPGDPRKVQSLSILIDGDIRGAEGAGDVDLIHQPDNVETTRRWLLFQEDPGSHNQYAPNDPNGTTARIWRYDLRTGELDVVARVDQSADPAARQGAWESSGIVDARRAFGRGWFLLDVQAGTLVLDREPDPRTGGFFEREGGQLLRIYIPDGGGDSGDEEDDEEDDEDDED